MSVELLAAAKRKEAHGFGRPPCGGGDCSRVLALSFEDMIMDGCVNIKNMSDEELMREFTDRDAFYIFNETKQEINQYDISFNDRRSA